MRFEKGFQETFSCVLLQTYDVPSYDIDPEPEVFQYPSEGRFSNRGLRRSQSFATTSRYNEPNTLHRSFSRQSFSSELQVMKKTSLCSSALF